MVVDSNFEFPFLATLITVHYDNLNKNDFISKEIEKRKKIYSYQGKHIYNLSTLPNSYSREKKLSDNPNSNNQISIANEINITSANGNLNKAYNLDKQLDSLIEQMRLNNYKTAEVIGISWWICVQKVKDTLNSTLINSSLRINSRINYDCTDLVPAYPIITESDKILHGIRFPRISKGVLDRYNSFNTNT